MTWDEDKEYRGLIIKEIEGCMGNIHEYGLALAAGRRRKKRVYLQGFHDTNKKWQNTGRTTTHRWDAHK